MKYANVVFVIYKYDILQCFSGVVQIIVIKNNP